MNHTYRLVWNRVQRIWVPVAESARACGKATRSATSCRPFKPLLLCALALAGAQVQAAPQQGQVPAGTGSATITQSGPASATTTIKQDSQKAVINWHSFDVGAGESVQFVQPNAGAIALNRVTGGQGRSQIDGKLHGQRAGVRAQPQRRAVRQGGASQCRGAGGEHVPALRR